MSKRVSVTEGSSIKVDNLHTFTCDESSISKAFRKEINHHNQLLEGPVRFILVQDGEKFVGHSGLIGDVLGWDHNFSYEMKSDHSGQLKRVRRIPFRHAYKLSPNEKLPDSDELVSRLKGDLEDLLNRRHAGEQKIVSDVNFNSVRRQGTAWDEVANAFESGAQDGHISFFDGEKHIGTVDVEKKTSGKWVGKVLQNRRALLGAGIAAAVIGTGLYLATHDRGQSGPER